MDKFDRASDRYAFGLCAAASIWAKASTCMYRWDFSRLHDDGLRALGGCVICDRICDTAQQRKSGESSDRKQRKNAAIIGEGCGFGGFKLLEGQSGCSKLPFARPLMVRMANATTATATSDNSNMPMISWV